MRAVDERLVTGVTMSGGHETFDNAELVVEHLDHDRKAVGRAGCVRDHGVLVGIVGVVVHAEDERCITRRWCGDEYSLGAGVEVRARSFLRVEDTGRLDDDVDVELAPWEVRWVALGVDLQAVGANLEFLLACGDLLREASVDAVVAKEHRHGVDVTKVVDRDELDVGACGLCGTEVVSSDSAEAVDCYANCHGIGSPFTEISHPLF